ncbi:macro domain-containing protein [Paenibacillus sanguinis]|uniref:macro domain-containing protein n=1 Tax=Paenibacillus sanguinis TaxID=225906 RepID=UPI00037D4668|nr:macro domain-containing protein [Paenibacillus sanguinis]
MMLREIQADLFEMEEAYHLAHCISADAKMGAGIAVQFRQRFDLNALQEQARSQPLEIGICYAVGRTLNLVTKDKYWHKPTYGTLNASLASMKSVCEAEGITKLAMPQIGCGLDRLKWNKVKPMIQEVFEGTGIEIVVCSL